MFERPFTILDGGLATELEARGCDLADPLWSAKMLLEAPERVRAVHRAYVEAGAEILTTATYQATIPGLRARGLDETQARALLREAVALARAEAGTSLAARGGTPHATSLGLSADGFVAETCSTPSTAAFRLRALAENPGARSREEFHHGLLVAASIGSYGAYLADGSEFRGDYDLDIEALIDFHRARLLELSAAGPDLLAFETIPSAIEAAAIARLLTTIPGPPAWVSFSLRPEPNDEPRISDGARLREAVAPLLGHPRVAALGVNCLAPGAVLAAIEELASVAPGLPIVAYPNAGERWIEQRWAGEQTEIETFTALAEQWWRAGARLIGGCCRTGPAHTKALVNLRARLSTAT